MANVGDFDYIELPAPAAWRKLFYPGNVGTPRKPSVVFLAPGGEEIKSRRQLKNYLTENPDNPEVTEFDWTTGETPRRSSKLSQKAKATVTPSGESSAKRRRSSRGKEHANEVVNDNEEAKHADQEVVVGGDGKNKQAGTDEVAESNHDADKTWKEEVAESNREATQQVEEDGMKDAKKDEEVWKEETGENDPESRKGTEEAVKEEIEAAPTVENEVKSETYYEIKSESE